MPSFRLSTRNSLFSLSVGLGLAIIIILLACADHQIVALERSAVGGSPYPQTWHHEARGKGVSIDNQPGLSTKSDSAIRKRHPGSVATDNQDRSDSQNAVLAAVDSHSSSVIHALNGETADPEARPEAGAVDAVPQLDRRADGRTPEELEAAIKKQTAPLDDATWESQKDNGDEGRDAEEKDESWKDALRKGKHLEELWQMESIPAKEQSRFWQHDQIKASGWVRNEQPGAETSNIEVALETLNIPSKDGWVTIMFDHRWMSHPPQRGRSYPPTKAYFTLAIDPKYGVAILKNAEGPEHTGAGSGMNPRRLVPLRYLSDFMFLEWQYLCERAKIDPASLKYIIHDRVRNDESRDIARVAVGGFLSAALNIWPGNSFKFAAAGGPDTATAILGSPNGVSVGRMLAQRTQVLGPDRRIVNAVLWKRRQELKWEFESEGPELHMLFELSDAHVLGTGLQTPSSSSKRSGSPGLDTTSVKRPATTGARLKRRGIEKRSDILDDLIWRSQKTDGQEGGDKEEAKKHWNDALSRGRMLEMFTAAVSSPAMAKSLYSLHDQIERNGFAREGIPMMVPFTEGLAVALSGLNIPLEDGWTKVAFRRSHETPRGGRTDDLANKEFYTLTFNPKLHIIMVLEAHPPTPEGEGSPSVFDPFAQSPSEPQMRLYHLAFLEWQSLCAQQGVKPASLKYFVRSVISDVPTRDVARKAVWGPLSANVHEWAGNNFNANENPDATKALLGSLRGVVVGSLLQEYKRELGSRRVVEAVIWKARPMSKADFRAKGPYLFMMFELDGVDGDTSDVQGSLVN